MRVCNLNVKTILEKPGSDSNVIFSVLFSTPLLTNGFDFEQVTMPEGSMLVCILQTKTNCEYWIFKDFPFVIENKYSGNILIFSCQLQELHGSTLCLCFHLLHTVSFDWFLPSLECILFLEFFSLKLLIFYQELLRNSITPILV